jgi:hypothetical protein
MPDQAANLRALAGPVDTFERDEETRMFHVKSGGCQRCHSERSEESLHLQNQANTEILRRSPRRPPQDDSLGGSSAACKAAS